MATPYSISIYNLFNGLDENGKQYEKPYTFVIKPYQRGYRWEPVHINHLIEDLLQFKQDSEPEKKKNYCLQPIIIKEFDVANNEWELVDGQQRSISLWLMRRICFWFRDDPDETDERYYALRFENKPKLQELVDIICEKTKEPESAVKFIKKMQDEEAQGNQFYLYDYFGIAPGVNIDVDCMMECIRAILSYKKIKNVLENIFISADTSVLPKSSSILVVWYQLEKNQNPNLDDDAITVFSNINANKIKLTESELIKAQLLYNLRTLQQRDEEEAKMALRWEEIERTLCDDSFWYFLNAGDGQESGTRIDFLFEIWSKIEGDEIGCVNKQELKEGWEKSDYPLSDLIENTLKFTDNKAVIAMEIWHKICQILETLNDWRNDYYFYHMIGLIVAVNKFSPNSKYTAADIMQRCIEKYQRMLSKEEFKDYLKSEIREQMYSISKTKNFYDFVSSMDTWLYEDKEQQNRIKIVLLMHNIAALINAQNEHERFPFELFFSDGYDIEHVNPQNPDQENEEALKEWYAAMAIDYDSSKGVGQLLKDAKTYADNHQIHSIGNLVLLDSNTNRAYKNKSFFEKRNEIINILRTGKRYKDNDVAIERYIPIGTKWVFLKAFSDLKDTDKASVHHIWDGQDEYKKDIINNLWLMQSGFKKVGGKLTYSEYDSSGNNVCAKGVVLDNSGKYYYLDWNEDKTELVNKIGIIDVTGVASNGLLLEGKYTFDGNGGITEVKDGDNAEGVDAL